MHRKGLALLTLLPSAYLVFFMALFAVTAATSDSENGEPPIPFALLAALHIGTMVLVIVLLVIYIRDAYGNPRLPEDKRTFWAVVLFMGNMIAMPIYWWLYMRPGPVADSPPR